MSRIGVSSEFDRVGSNRILKTGGQLFLQEEAQNVPDCFVLPLSSRPVETRGSTLSEWVYDAEPVHQMAGLILSDHWLLKAIGEDRVADTPILKLHLTSSLLKNPVLQILFDISREPPGQGNCMLTTFMARLGKRSFLMFFHIPVGGCRDPSISACAAGRFPVARLGSPARKVESDL